MQSELFANEQMPQVEGDPRVAAALKDPLVPEHHSHSHHGARMTHQTRRSELRVGAAMEHQVFGPDDMQVESSCSNNVGRTTVITRLSPASRCASSSTWPTAGRAPARSPAIVDQVEAALDASRYTGWDGLVAAQREYLDAFWARADVEIDGDPRLQQAIRFSLFHVLQAGARAEKRAIGAKGLTGQGYDGHSLWDTETFVLPVFMFTQPRAAADALRWRHSTLDVAQAHAAHLGLKGAAFAWRTIRGEECSGYWPAGTAAFHVNADIADAVLRYVGATADDDFEREVGVDLLVATARLWRSLGHHDAESNFRIDGVTGPDEYSAVADNNVYTNLMAQRNLRGAADVSVRHPREAERLGVSSEEIASWRAAAHAMVIPYDEKLGIHAQAEGFTSHALWDFEHTPEDHYPLLLNYPYFDLYRKQVVKQPDLVLAMVQCPDAFTQEQKAANFAYYERITVRDSSLSPGTLAVMAAETGHLDLAYDYLCESSQMDLADLENNVRDGIHLAALAELVDRGRPGPRRDAHAQRPADVLAAAALGGVRTAVPGALAGPLGPRRGRRTGRRPTRSRRSPSTTPGPAGMAPTSTEDLDLRHHDEEFTLRRGAAADLRDPVGPAPRTDRAAARAGSAVPPDAPVAARAAERPGRLPPASGATGEVVPGERGAGGRSAGPGSALRGPPVAELVGLTAEHGAAAVLVPASWSWSCWVVVGCVVGGGGAWVVVTTGGGACVVVGASVVVRRVRVLVSSVVVVVVVGASDGTTAGAGAGSWVVPFESSA